MTCISYYILNIKYMGIRVGRDVVIGINLTFELFRCKTRSRYVYNETEEKKKVSAISLHETLHIN